MFPVWMESQCESRFGHLRVRAALAIMATWKIRPEDRRIENNFTEEFVFGQSIDI